VAPLAFLSNETTAEARASLAGAEGAHDARLALKALGDVPPFSWFVNGEPVGEADLRRQSAWKPDGVRVSVVDGKGASDVVVVRLE
jgi:penicillin-binding protein 1C